MVDINLATVAELMTLPGIDKDVAHRIVARRQEVGRFEVVEDLLEIEGITRGLLAEIRDQITVGTPPLPEPEPLVVQLQAPNGAAADYTGHRVSVDSQRTTEYQRVIPFAVSVPTSIGGVAS